MTALFSIENNYDQPDNNLIVLFKKKPTIETLGKYLGGFPNDNDEITMSIVKIWSGEECRIENVDYRLEEIEFDKAI